MPDYRSACCAGVGGVVIGLLRHALIPYPQFFCYNRQSCLNILEINLMEPLGFTEKPKAATLRIIPSTDQSILTRS